MILQPEACRDVHRAAVRRGDQLAVRQAWCPVPELRLARVSSSAQVLLWVRRSGQPSQGGPQARRAKETALPKARALDVPQVPLRAALLLAAWERDAPRVELPPEAVSACAAERPAEVASARAVAEPRPEAATVVSEQPAVGAAAAVPDESAPAEAAVSDVTVRRPAAARREDAEVQPRAAARSDVRELQAVLRPEEAARPGAQRAAVPLALPSAAASVFRQGRSLAGPERRRAAARFAHAMRSLPIASRSEPWWQAARNED